MVASQPLLCIDRGTVGVGTGDPNLKTKRNCWLLGEVPLYACSDQTGHRKLGCMLGAPQGPGGKGGAFLWGNVKC